ncbi:MAG TPA: M23 family peptidase, partial [Pseudoxanthomonas sp.]|nr:M23 family peptidase [Pseudoxanthomonas sp.]
MNLKNLLNHTRARLIPAWRSSGAARALIHSRSLSSASFLIVGGLVLGFGLRSATGLAQVSMLQAKSERQQLEL